MSDIDIDLDLNEFQSSFELTSYITDGLKGTIDRLLGFKALSSLRVI